MEWRSEKLPQTMAKALVLVSPLADLCGFLHCLFQALLDVIIWLQEAQLQQQEQTILCTLGTGSVASSPLHPLHNTDAVSAL